MKLPAIGEAFEIDRRDGEGREKVRVFAVAPTADGKAIVTFVVIATDEHVTVELPNVKL